MKINMKIKISSPAKKVWHVLAENFGNFDEWTTALDKSEMVGEIGVDAVRICHSPGVGPFPASVVEERIVAFNPENMNYTYLVQSGLPGIFKSAQNTWTIQAINESNSVVHSEVEAKLVFWLRPLSWLFPLLIKRDLNKISEEMIYFIEKGEIHPRKRKALLKSKLNQPT